MLILGLNNLSHDTSAALIEDGKVLFAIEEERLNKEKHTRAFPLEAVEACLKFARATIKDVDVICTPQLTDRLIKKRYLEHWLNFFPKANPRMCAEFGAVSAILNGENEIREKLNFQKEIYYCRHHVSHMASAYYLSKFLGSALFTIDGLGEIESFLVGEANGNIIRTFDEYSAYWPHSIGGLYTALTHYLGFIPHCDEGKVMGLAPYGNPETYKKVFEDMVYFKEKGVFEFNLDYVQYPFRRHSHMSEKFMERCGPVREPKAEITERHKDIAAALQYATEKTMLHIADHLFSLTKNENLCMAGGVALNCVANGKVLTQTPFKHVYIQPAANDAGQAIGAALYYYYQKNPEAERHSLDHSYLGTGFHDEEIERTLRLRNISFTPLDTESFNLRAGDEKQVYEKPNKNPVLQDADLTGFIRNENLFSTVAKLLAEGKIIAWFNGRMEFGPRSLGNRSIITAPYPAEMKDILNARVKKRESFRPFAPSVRLEDCAEYFDNDHESPYMLLTYNVRKDKITKIPAITHVDGTARVQTVSMSQNPEFYRLISEFKNFTGVGVLLNTSFNVMGQPIIHTPQEALDCFLSTDIDYLVFNAKYLIAKNDPDKK